MDLLDLSCHEYLVGPSYHAYLWNLSCRDNLSSPSCHVGRDNPLDLSCLLDHDSLSGLCNRVGLLDRALVSYLTECLCRNPVVFDNSLVFRALEEEELSVDRMQDLFSGQMQKEANQALTSKGVVQEPIEAVNQTGEEFPVAQLEVSVLAILVEAVLECLVVEVVEAVPVVELEFLRLEFRLQLSGY